MVRLHVPALVLAGLMGATSAAAEAVRLNQYALVLPGNLPHLMHAIRDHRAALGLDARQSAEVDAILSEVPAKIRPLFQKGEEMEKAISADVLTGHVGPDLKARLDALQTVKREAAEVHIACIARVRAMLSADQYQRVLTLAQAETK